MTQEIIVTVEDPSNEIVVTVEESPVEVDVVVSEVGLPGPKGDASTVPGPQGIPGPRGLPGTPGGTPEYEETYYFATPLTEWVIEHNQNNLYLSVLTFDQTGEQVHGAVSYVDSNTIKVDWYFAMSGHARVYE